ncbi:MAG: hemerythrin domain-containing protein, partial [Bacteroidales bacterium]|nr:hemerythrin domain-containing protein [Bacteroidales bacterium]
FEENHSNIEEKLHDLKNIVIKYLPENASQQSRINVLNEIFKIENDLNKHSVIENKILIPLVSKYE